jgi:hypothetical protein
VLAATVENITAAAAARATLDNTLEFIPVLLQEVEVQAGAIVQPAAPRKSLSLRPDSVFAAVRAMRHTVDRSMRHWIAWDPERPHRGEQILYNFARLAPSLLLARSAIAIV